MPARFCSSSCKNAGTDAIQCFACHTYCHHRCYSLPKNAASILVENASFKFMCDRCTELIGRTSNVNVSVSTLSRNIASMTDELKEMKETVSGLKTKVHDVVVNQVPPSSFEAMVDELKEVKKTTLESAAIVNKFDPMVQNSKNDEIVELLKSINDSLAGKSKDVPSANEQKIIGILTEIQSSTKNSYVPKQMFPSYSSVIGGKRSHAMIDTNPTTPSTRAPAITSTGPETTDFIIGRRSKWNEEKALVISPLHPATTIAQVKTFVTKKLEISNDSNDISIVSLAPRGRALNELNFVSFKVLFVDSLSEKLSSPSFWPSGTSIRPFEKRERKLRTVLMPIENSTDDSPAKRTPIRRFKNAKPIVEVDLTHTDRTEMPDASNAMDEN